MAIQKSLSSFVIGSDGLLIECTEVLLRQGHEVRGVISDAPRIVRWARERGLALVDPRAYVETLRRAPFDYLFAITHLAVLPDDVLALPTKGAVNFHDGPLPRYAGLNAPAWALMNRETTYGVTWHLIGSKVDAGDIVKQVTFDLAPDETSLSLNTKCFAHAIESFAELLPELSSETAVATPQPSTGRSYFGRYRRPEAACVIDWTRPATSIEAMVRALDFGDRYANGLGIAKVHAGDETFLVTRATAEPDAHGVAPGDVTFVRDDAVGVATGEGVIAIMGAAKLDGRPMPLSELAETLHLAVGSRFENPPADMRARWSALDATLCRAESFWIERLRGAEPLEAPYAVPAWHAPSGRRLEVPLVLPEDFAEIASLVAVFSLACARLVHKDAFSIGVVWGALAREVKEADPWLAKAVPLSTSMDWKGGFAAHRERLRAELDDLAERKTYLRDLLARTPGLGGRSELADGSAWPVCVAIDGEPPATCALALVVPPDGTPRLSFDTRALPEERAHDFVRHLTRLAESAVRSPDAPVGELAIMDDAERTSVLREPNETARSYRRACVQRLFEEQVARTPDRTALLFEEEELSYRELDARANRLAAHLRTLGVGPDVLVGIHVERSLDLVVAALATWKAGGAYVPLDPAYPPERIAFMLDDAKLRVVLTSAKGATSLRPKEGMAIVRLDADADRIARCPDGPLDGGAIPENLAYVIYTSGSTGTPKGVMVQHDNLASFFAGMDDRIPHDPAGTWLAVTSLSFDISALELFWPLTHGFRVVLHRDRDKEVGHAPHPVRVRTLGRPMEFSLFYFSSDESEESQDKYELLLEGAKFADAHGFVAVWTPERHFHAFGGLYPNPAVTGAALAVITEKVQIRAGSVVLPLHHPARVAEAWSVVDNLSHGRVGISFASGWQPNDFVLRPESFADNKKIMFRDLEIVKALWRGESVRFPGPKGDEVPIRTLPRPVQKELPIWITTAGNVDTYKAAGRIGANVLTHLLGQSVEELAPKIRAYREARREHGHDPEAGVVSLMLHTFVGDDESEVRARVRDPLKRYLGSSLELLKQYAWAFPAFSRPKDVTGDAGDDLTRLSDEERDALLEHAYGRYYETSGLFGRAEDCIRRIDELRAIGVNEVACLIDFGIDTRTTLDHLAHLDRLHRMVRATESGDGELGHSIPALIRRHGVTHLQCTPSMVRMLLDDPEARAALAGLRCWMVGGEALPSELAREIRSATPAALHNMYGPTETTVWSTTHAVANGETTIYIGRPIANTRVYVLDPRGQPLPRGATGELYIAGDGVARGYLGRDELTRERFVADPFAGGGRMYRTGDLARWTREGVLECLGRRDQQVKIRGHRVELGEIESTLLALPEVAECAVVLREDALGDQRLVAYVVGAAGPKRAELDGAALREAARARLPDFMVPAHVVLLSELPLTPNRKIDRRALPPPEQVGASRETAYVAPASDIERTIANLWQELLGRERIGIEDNFFDVGGHSLLVVRMHRRLRELIPQPVTLTDLYRFPTIRSLTDFLTRDAADDEDGGALRAERRREMGMRRRRSHV
jgi:natural product biosynthesis luciferase-like monooxygenase protein